MDNVPNLICSAGHKAMLEARAIWGGMQENEVREEFLSALMAVHLHKALNAPIRVEIDYAALYKQLGFEPTADTIIKVSGCRADVVIYDNNLRPKNIIEVKKFAEGAYVSGIIADLHKGDPIELSKHVTVYAGIFVCETNDSLEERMRTLEKIGMPVVFSPRQAALNGEWSWCFGCMTYTPQNIAF